MKIMFYNRKIIFQLKFETEKKIDHLNFKENSAFRIFPRSVNQFNICYAEKRHINYQDHVRKRTVLLLPLMTGKSESFWNEVIKLRIYFIICPITGCGHRFTAQLKTRLALSTCLSRSAFMYLAK